ncbi:Myosin-2 heavy chain, non muscle like [Actinidia chinensis var. chinensis]|uniref:Myosin-2 heavy chain, non muscle like n=1 Tax=Actinidia chinensis var. chinensis TaxID=1590841 RepID=A0A2R6QCA3_ACTCC|nr:Myosin-2 heavy chain, non muscle like [Actinidia chinensis var. chinensis]
MGGTLKVGQNRGRQYGLMLFVSFGAAIFGVMLLHKLREGRIFNLLVQEKDNQLVYLHRLLQKERDYNKEAKRKNEVMKAKIYSLRIQKGELDSRILEMESTISSLKDEQRTVESALEENQTEIKSLQEKKIEANKENPQVVALTETLKQKEAEIEDLKRLLKYPVKVWSMSADDPSNSAGNVTQTTSINESIDRDGDVIRDDGMGFTNTRGMIDEHSQNIENSWNAVFRERDTAGEKSSDEVHGKKSTDSQDDGLGVSEAKNNANATETIVNHGDDGKTRDEYEHEIAGTGETENLKSQSGAGDTLRGKQGHAKHPKGKRWRTIARKRRQGSGVNAEMDSASIQSRLRNDAQQSASYKRLRDGELLKLDRQGANRQQDESSETKNDDKVGLEGGEEPKDRSKPQNSIDAENKSDGGGKIDINQHENFEKPNRTTESEDNEIAGDVGKQKSDELGQSEERAGGVQRQTESTNDEKVDENSEEVKVGDKYKEPEDLEGAETQEAETGIWESRAGVAETQEAEADIRESRAEADEVKEESGEETDEPEF